MRNQPIDREKLVALQAQGLTPLEVSAELGCTESACLKVAKRIGSPFLHGTRGGQRKATRRCITCKKPRATEARWICASCRARHRREGVEYVETHSIPGITP